MCACMPRNEKKTLDIAAIFSSDAQDIRKSREDAMRIHGTDIRAAGNEVEACLRDYFKRMLPSKFYITHGHLIDINGQVSPQLDIIVADNSNLPSLMTTKDGTEYVPIDSVYAIGEIKSTYYKSKRYFEAFSEVLEDIRERLYHEEMQNTAFDGINGHTTLRDMTLEKGNRILNRLFSFMFFVDAGDFEFDNISEFCTNRNNRYLPSITVLLNKGTIVWGLLEEQRLAFNRYPEDIKSEQEDWFFCPYPGDGSAGSLEGNHLGFLYYSLLEHLSNSYLEPPSLKNLLAKMMIGRKSLVRKARGS
jgi:hypothetical protein